LTPGEVLFQIDDRIYKQRVHQAQATLAMKEAALRNNLAASFIARVAWAWCTRCL
jgi:multidrug resistance efflux pump